MKMKPTHFAIASLLLMACGQDEQLLLPDNIEVQWDVSFNALGDGLGAVVPVDIMVYDRVSGDPLAGVDVDLHVDEQHIQLLRTSEVSPVVTRCEDCEALWDAYSDEYYELNGLPVGSNVPLQLITDEDGLAQFYVVVDAFAARNGSFLSVQVEAETEAVQGSFFLQPR